ncbi:MAG: hypothetical protein ACP5NY_03915 [Thermocladium sp.]
MINCIKAKLTDRVTINTKMIAMCPVTNTIDNYSVTIEYKPNCEDPEGCQYIELKSLREYLDSFRDRLIYHEDLINELLKTIQETCDPDELRIVLNSEYMGMRYTIELNA